MDCNMLVFLVHHQLPELAQTHIHQVGMPSNHLILCHPFLILLSVFPSIRVFSNESVLHIRCFSISPSNEYSRLISLGLTGWISLHPKGLSRVFSNTIFKASTFLHLAFYVVQLSHPYMTIGKTIALTRWTFVSK